ncbi:hypothetical protein KAM429_32390 [Aquipseudomonas alcaligenes]|uniref:Uncharacterized protein n=2 Tax=Aquipseudomonas alcaligenes TaxID=43263 RepID=A0AA37FMN4_AQUAC|nr:hypothetical protein KAM428_30480 [Pseudomonas alcaligenes]GIZ72478.1 hypothetical protein KAM429_32390 [Pseudomonas alcaligenes]GIZ76805.1 hypothetical protein KAM430_32140 [Pseudomonas alcaligenes]GIZ80937.1 hypothetical protein KAM432_29850 [Pseudomonas alcaligenes]GIZ85448.1 hypothetical protein KAM434_31430 [Pseudomonas alcaligenes]
MAIEMHKARFVLACLASFMALGGSYFLLIDRLAIVDNPLGVSYRQFLLRATDDIPDRVIVESGSNSIHAVDAQAIEQHFGRPTVIISDSGGYPLSHKIERLANHLKAGDTLVLPLEWVQYRADDILPAVYVESILDERGSNAFYYRELSWPERFRFVYQSVPPRLGLQAALRLNGLASRNPHIAASTQESLVRFESEIRLSARGSQLIGERPELDSLTRDLACDHYLFGVFEFPQISETFRDNLQHLAALRDTSGATIFFAWPAVVARDDNECYQIYSQEIESYVSRIRQLAKEQGFSFLGTPEQSRFDHSCMLDTYYHVSSKCAEIRTARLITDLQAHGLKPKPQFDEAAIQRHLLNYLQKYGASGQTTNSASELALHDIPASSDAPSALQ